jgi:hypothetical protein
MNMRTPTEDIIRSRTWLGAQAPDIDGPAPTLTVHAIDSSQGWVVLSAVDGPPRKVVSVLLDGTQIDELITDLLARRALLASRHAGSGRSDR